MKLTIEYTLKPSSIGRFVECPSSALPGPTGGGSYVARQGQMDHEIASVVIRGVESHAKEFIDEIPEEWLP
jgi:hypothetical protein